MKTNKKSILVVFIVLGHFVLANLYAENKVFDLNEIKKLNTDIAPGERQSIRASFDQQYSQIAKELYKNLQEASRKHYADRRYYSPLHALILMTETWQLRAADDLLLNLLGYTLDIRSFPIGISVGGSFFFPAAYVLSRSSIEPGKIVEKMASIKDEKQLRLLLWILTERLGNQTSNYLEQNILENEYIVDKTNLQKALLLLKSVPHTHDLLPAIHQNL